MTVVESYEVLFDDPADLAAAADIHGVATVSAVEPIGIVDSTDDPNPDELVKVVLEFENAEKDVSIAWPAFLTDGSNRVARISYNGIEQPVSGETLYLFLEELSTSSSQQLHGTTHRVLTTDGFYRIVDGVLRSHIDSGDRVAAILNGTTLEDLPGLLDGDAG